MAPASTLASRATPGASAAKGTGQWPRPGVLMCVCLRGEEDACVACMYALGSRRGRSMGRFRSEPPLLGAQARRVRTLSGKSSHECRHCTTSDAPRPIDKAQRARRDSWSDAETLSIPTIFGGRSKAIGGAASLTEDEIRDPVGTGEWMARPTHWTDKTRSVWEETPTVYPVCTWRWWFVSQVGGLAGVRSEHKENRQNDRTPFIETSEQGSGKPFFIITILSIYVYGGGQAGQSANIWNQETELVAIFWGCKYNPVITDGERTREEKQVCM